eukprot:gene21788-16252_t
MLRLLEAMKEEEVRQQYVGGMKVFVRTLAGKTLALMVDPFADVTVLKGMIRDREGMPVDQLRLIYAGRQLEDGRSLIDQGVHNEATLHLVLRLRGGPSTAQPQALEDLIASLDRQSEV